MRIAATGRYWIRVNNMTNGKSITTSYDGFMTLSEAREEFYKYCRTLNAVKSDCYVFIIDKTNNIKALKRVGGNI